MITIRMRLSSLLWFASGVVMTLVAVVVFQPWSVTATPGPDEATFVPMTPCRLFDTRAGSNTVGPRNTPLGPNESHLQSVHGANGNCQVPSDATGVAMNVTTLNSTAQSFLAVYPADASLPLASNLNWSAGQGPTPNKVDVKLSATGQLRFYNAVGTVNVFADVVGYYTRTGLASLQSQIDTLATRFPRSGYSHLVGQVTVTSPDTPVTLRQVSITTPRAGRVIVTASFTISSPTSNFSVICGINNANSLGENLFYWNKGTSAEEPVAATKGFDVTASNLPRTFRVTCIRNPFVLSGSASVVNPMITAIYIPDP
jgi:hypothetical protein